MKLYILRIISKKNKIIVVSINVSTFLLKRSIINNWLTAYVTPCLNNIEIKAISCTKKIVFAMYRVTDKKLIDTYGFDLIMKLMQKVKEKYSLLIFMEKKADQIWMLY